MKEILDQEIEPTSGDEQSRAACKFFIVNIVCVIVLVVMTFFVRTPLGGEMMSNFFMALLLLFFALTLLGFRNAILSVLKKEKWTYIKIVGLVGNALFFAMVLFLFLGNVADILNFAN